MIPLGVRAPGVAEAARTATGKIDSGADLCGVPRELIELAGLPPLRRVRAASFTGELTHAVVYRVEVEVDGDWIEGIECIATQRPYVIVGRNVLAHFIVRLDGPRARLEIR